MARRARVAPGGLVYHVLNRSVAGLPLFRKEADYEAFERIMVEAQRLHPTRILAWCVMRNHWHYVERNALTAHVVERAEDWRWGSLWTRRHGDEQLKAILSDWPMERPADWANLVNEPMTEKEAESP